MSRSAISRPRATDPPPQEIAAPCLQIQSGWGDEERLRADWRPMVRCADGRLVAVCVDD